ncbi:hypothetical protein GCK32_010500 [Trichostrongylus colubriformis]|uniref:Uncharacterized protein n=1 Tax=Trichostrongylus colubriformis TaxID=6319 RepID=A0AAN8FEP2_TRICO
MLGLVQFLLFVFVVPLPFGEGQQLSMILESLNLRSNQSTDLTCSRIREILLNKILLKDWHCIGGTKASFHEPGMWIIATSPLVGVAEKKMPLEIAYDEKSHDKRLSTIFELEDDVNRQLRSTAAMQGYPINVTMTYIQFRADKVSPCSGGISAGGIVALIEGIILLVICGSVAFRFYAKKRAHMHNALEREGEENFGTETD